MALTKKPRTAKRKFRKTKSTKNKIARVTSSVHPIPDVFRTTLMYSDLVVLSYTGTNTYYQFNLNNLNDPNRTGSGHQPNGYDQLSTLYTRTRVTGAKYDITLSNGSATYQAEAVIQLTSNTTTSANFEEAIESKYARLLTMDPYGAESKNIKGYVNLSKLFGVPRRVLMTDESYTAGIGGNPANQCCLNIWFQNKSPGLSMTGYARINITYYVDFFESRIFSQS